MRLRLGLKRLRCSQVRTIWMWIIPKYWIISGCEELIHGIGYHYDQDSLIRSAVRYNILDPKICHENCLSEPACIAWHLRSEDNCCVPVSHYKGVIPKPGWVSGRRNVCIGIVWPATNPDHGLAFLLQRMRRTLYGVFRLILALRIQSSRCK